jgi:acetoin utilization deacetylase AcuC-like enzyme
VKCFYHPEQERHAPPSFLLRGRQVASPEGPVRAEMLLEGLASLGITVTAPADTDSPGLRDRLSRVHTPRYLAFLETIHARWSALPDAAEVVAPNVHPCGGGPPLPASSGRPGRLAHA